MKRNHGLDLIKAICAFLVICNHAPFPDVISRNIIPLTRICIPIFFMITGYYYTFTKERNHVEKQVHKIFYLFAGANLLFFVERLMIAWISNESLSAEISKMFSIKSIFEFVLFNNSPFSEHLWYLGAILYVLLIIMFFEKKWNRQKLYPFVPFLLMTDLILGKYSLLLLGQTIPYIWVRNFLCVGLPYFLIGDWIYTHSIKVQVGKARILIIIFVLTNLFERFLLCAFSANAVREHYISTTFLSVFVFLLAMQHEEMYKNKVLALLCCVGAKFSTSIYILHFIVISIIVKIIEYLSWYIPFIGVLYSYLAPLVIFIFTTVGVWILNEVTKKINIKLCCIRK